MSRIGKKPVTVPKGVTVTLKGQEIAVKGPKGELKRAVPPLVKVNVAGAEITVERSSEDGPARAQHGLMRALLQNMVTGVTEGFERKLEINGVGYKAEIAGEKMTLSLGYSHPIVFPLPKGVSAKVDKNILALSGIDKELVGETAAKVRSFRPPEPYKGKGVKYADEVIRRKVGKTGAAWRESTMPAVKKIKSVKVAARSRRKVSIRKKITGTAERPRLSVFRSARHIYVQAIDDTTNSVLAAASDLEGDLKGESGQKKKDRAKAVGAAVAKRLLAKDIKLVVFDRNGFIYHGRVSAVADGAREAGLEF